MAMIKRITIIRTPSKKFVTKTDRIASAKYPIIRQPVTAPTDIAKKIFHGFMPINRPTIEPTRPPDPWNGTITKSTIPMNLSGLIQLYLLEDFLPMVSTFAIK